MVEQVSVERLMVVRFHLGAQNMEEKLDQLFSQFIRLRFSDWRGYGRCYTCGAIKYWQELQCGHFIRRGHHAVRWDENNARPQCVMCNCFDNGRPDVFEVNLREEIGDEEVDALIERGKGISQTDEEWLQSKVIHYKSIVQKLWK